MLWKIARPGFWVLDRKIRQTNRTVIIAALAVIAFGGQWVYNNLIREYVALLGTEQAATLIASFLPLWVFVLLFFAILSLGDIIHQIFLAPEIELLLVAPVPRGALFLQKLFQSSRAIVIPGLFFGALLVALGLEQNASWTYFALGLLLLLSIVLFVTSITICIAALLPRLLPPQKLRAWLPVVAVSLTFAYVLIQQPVTDWLVSQPGLYSYLTQALLDPNRLGVVTAVCACPAVIAATVAYLLFFVTFYEGWNRFQVVPTQRATRTVQSRTSRQRFWKKLIPAPLRHFLVKEWLELRREPRSLMTLAQPLTLLVFFAPVVLSNDTGYEQMRPIIFWPLVLFLAFYSATIPVGTSMMAIIAEGRNIDLIRAVPIKMKDAIAGKFIAWWFPLVVAWSIGPALLALWLGMTPWQIAFLVGVVVWGLTGASALSLVMGALKADLGEKDVRKRVSTSAVYLTMGLNSVFVALTLALATWLMGRIYPDSNTVTVIRVVAGFFSPAGWLLADSVWPFVAVICTQVAFWAGIRALWVAAARRLETIEL